MMAHSGHFSPQLHFTLICISNPQFSALCQLCNFHYRDYWFISEKPSDLAPNFPPLVYHQFIRTPKDKWLCRFVWAWIIGPNHVSLFAACVGSCNRWGFCLKLSCYSRIHYSNRNSFYQKIFIWIYIFKVIY